MFYYARRNTRERHTHFHPLRCQQDIALVLQKRGSKKWNVSGPSSLFLGHHSQQRGDERDLPPHIPFGRALQLPFSQYIHHLISLERSPRGLEREKAHPWLCQPLRKGWMNRWSCSMRLLRYFTCHNATCSGRTPAAFRSAMALGYAAWHPFRVIRFHHCFSLRGNKKSPV
jgi:hypothetical protein